MLDRAANAVLQPGKSHANAEERKGMIGHRAGQAQGGRARLAPVCVLTCASRAPRLEKLLPQSEHVNESATAAGVFEDVALPCARRESSGRLADRPLDGTVGGPGASSCLLVDIFPGRRS